MMNDKSLAHPYANAIFALAKEANTIDSWYANLQQLKTVCVNDSYSELVHSPINKDKVISIILQVAKLPESKELTEFLSVLEENDRLGLLSDIFDLFEQLVEVERNTAKAIIYSAYDMNDSEKLQFEKMLSKKFDKKVSATVEIKSDLIGGVKILINDITIDYSIKGSLDKLAIQLIG